MTQKKCTEDDRAWWKRFTAGLSKHQLKHIMAGCENDIRRGEAAAFALPFLRAALVRGHSHQLRINKRNRK